MIALAVANGLLAHHKCRVLGWPCRIDFSRADALLIASKGSATSMSFLRTYIGGVCLAMMDVQHAAGAA